MADSLAGRAVAVLVTNGFEESEMTEPRAALQEAGAKVTLVAPGGGAAKSWAGKDWGQSFDSDAALDGVAAADFDALVLPGGVFNPDTLRTDAAAVKFVRDFVDGGKPVAAICHGPWTLIEAGAVKGRRMTSYPSVRTDLVNAGADWVDEEVVVDDGLVTSRKPDDLPAFNRAMIEVFAGDR